MLVELVWVLVRGCGSGGWKLVRSRGATRLTGREARSSSLLQAATQLARDRPIVGQVPGRMPTVLAAVV